jgi:hypothetical protein
MADLLLPLSCLVLAPCAAILACLTWDRLVVERRSHR